MVATVDHDTEVLHRPRRRRRGLGIGLLVVLLVLVGLVVAADRVGAGIAENRLVSVVETELDKQEITAAGTDVDIAGFPFLTQVASGRYDRITIVVDQLRSGGLSVKTLHIDAEDVTAEVSDLLSGAPKASAARVTGVATIAWDDLPRLLGYAGLGVGNATFAPAGEDVRVTGTVRVDGRQVPVSATAAFSVVKNQIRVKVSEASVAGADVPPEAKDYINNLQDELSVGYRVPPLPFGLTVTRVAATDAGLAVTAVAKDVPLAG
ncbi:DUF2993 domain-containing protein [Luedemannella helvata]|uniref:DUF2993 domain-containing protein n=1 Tax=Luedemannella helvata TaxID=349315 RepID=A0ABP4XBJ6_9ACTN